MSSRKPPLLDLTQLPHGPAPGAVLADMSTVPAGRGATIRLGHKERQVSVFVHRLADGAIVAYVNACPHLGVTLDLIPGKFLDLTGTRFICAMHGARFEPTTGLCVHGPCTGDYLQEVAIEIDGDLVKVRSVLTADTP